MKQVLATACAKVILTGEHATVYGQPSLLLPFPQLQAQVQVRFQAGPLQLEAPDLGECWHWDKLPRVLPPLLQTVEQTLIQLQQSACDLHLTIHSPIPIASGLGSGTAVTTALIRALYQWFERPLEISELLRQVHAIETLYHGTPSGMDSHVIGYAQPIWFVKGQPTEFLGSPAQPLHFLIADTGLPCRTREVVLGLRERLMAEPAYYQPLLEAIGQVSMQARMVWVQGNAHELGLLMNLNHTLLQQLGVSHPKLDRLVEAARMAGACGAKLSGAGQGGICLVLCQPEQTELLSQSLLEAGACQVYAMETQLDAVTDTHREVAS